MNPTHEPLDERVLDELLSADLDGELAAAAADLGLTVEQGRHAISSPAAVARRAALARAGSAVGEAAPLDPATTARLVTASITEARKDDELVAARRRRERRGDAARRVMVAAGSAAAVIAVIVGLANLPSSSGDRASMSAGAPTESDTAGGSPTKAAVELGDVSDNEQLRRQVAARLGLPDAPKGVASATTLSPQRRSSQLPTGEYATDGRDRRQQDRSVRACAPTARAAAGGGAPALTARAVSRGRPVTVYAFLHGDAYDVLVLGQDCSVVERLTVP